MVAICAGCPGLRAKQRCERCSIGARSTCRMSRRTKRRSCSTRCSAWISKAWWPSAATSHTGAKRDGLKSNAAAILRLPAGGNCSAEKEEAHDTEVNRDPRLHSPVRDRGDGEVAHAEGEHARRDQGVRRARGEVHRKTRRRLRCVQ